MKAIKQSSEASVKEGRKEILTGIPTSDLSQVIEDFVSEGAKVETNQEPDGSWTLTALFDN